MTRQRAEAGGGAGAAERLRLQDVHGRGNLVCRRCDLEAEVVASMSGSELALGFQCQRCGKLSRLSERRLREAGTWRSGHLPCECGGELSRNEPLFCPNCRSHEVEYVEFKGAPLFWNIQVNEPGTLSCARCSFVFEVESSSGLPFDRQSPLVVRLQCQECGELSGSEEVHHCECEGELSSDRVLFCPSCRTTQLKFRAASRPVLTFRNTGGEGQIICESCGATQAVTSFLHGPPGEDGQASWAAQGMQCQGCGRFTTVGLDAVASVCECGGRLAPDCPLFCPQCKSKDLTWEQGFMT